LDESGADHDDASDRRPEAFGEAELQAVERLPSLAEREGSRAGCFPESGTVQVHVNRKILGARPLRDGAHLGERHNRSHESVFQADDSCRAVPRFGGEDNVTFAVV